MMPGFAYFATDDLLPETHIQKYLQHTRYIDELLKFFEDEQYKYVLTHIHCRLV